jgi:glycosyltransferase involved in cell wall biosynthesis
MNRSRNVLFVVSPLYEFVGPNLSDLLRLLKSFMDSICLLRGKLRTPLSSHEGIEQIEVNNKVVEIIRKKGGILARVISYGLIQIIMAKILLGLLRRFDHILFYQSEAVIPALVARIMRRRVIVYVGGSGFRTLQAGGHWDKLLSLPLLMGERITFTLAHKIIVVTHQTAKSMRLSGKIFIAPTRLFDKEFFRKYQIKKKLSDREPIIGYVGRLTYEKGVEKLVDAFPHVISKLPAARLIIVGDGPLRGEIETKIFKYGMEKFISITGWLDNVELYLNEIKLLVLPSFTEGLPNILLEAMACGTPVLATPVGAIQDIIKEGETGFLLKSNDPKHIAERIIELLNKPRLLEKVSVNAYNYIRENFNFEKTLDAWRRI